ncbi:cobalamin B12-binding domain-containing protein [Streptomyces spiramenti]|uniref:Cobalamin B12-binding domain-containing protein n=1 Tax=Streptomyces spiramenti TaxID=2720606 RepID=A0ABX1AR05_9ACTN|nr:cobalamin-dependent protein [Streptomyces spiramenti]NJP67485.1 cobalamin B12-binding domain-containing protein [Streptomyces spiramenti]
MIVSTTERPGRGIDPGVYREQLWTALRDGDEYAAAAAVFEGLENGLGAERILLEVIAPAQGRVGEEWAANRMTVADEHVATAINERVIAALAHHPAGRVRPDRGRVTVACVEGEWHSLPARLLSEVLRLRGWRVDFLGAHVPTPHLIAHLHRTGPEAVLLSASIPTHLPTAHAAITAALAAGVPVLAGGAAFGPDGRYARSLGATEWAADARAVARLLHDGLPRPDPTAMHLPIEDLPHLADQEYTMIARTRAELVRGTLAGLEIRFPPMREYTARQRRHTAEDVAHIVDYLTTALYVDDVRLFTTFISWTGDILTAREVPAHTLGLTFDALGAQLKDFPRARALLDQGRATVTDSPHIPIPGNGKPA